MKAWRARTMPSCGAFFHAEKVTAAGTHCSGHRCVGMIANPDARRAGSTGVKHRIDGTSVLRRPSAARMGGEG